MNIILCEYLRIRNPYWHLRENLAAIYLSRLHSDYTTKIDTKVLKQTQHFEIKYRIDSQLIKLFVFYVNH